MLRALRHWLTAHTTGACLRLAPSLSGKRIDDLARLLARIAPHTPVLSKMVADNMRALGVYTPEVHRAYFANVAAHFGSAMHALACRDDPAARARLRQLVLERSPVDESVYRLPELAAADRGVVIMGPHLANFTLLLPRLNQVSPLTVYMRYSKDPQRREAKRRWCAAHEMLPLAQPPSMESGSKLGPLLAALAAGRTLYLTPDMPRPRGDGVAVTLFGREVWLPAGAAVLSVRSGAPMLLLLAKSTSDGPRLTLHEAPPAVLTGPEDARSQVQRYLQWFADETARFIAREPALWHSWADKRWTRVLRGDPRYVASPPAFTIHENETAKAP